MSSLKQWNPPERWIRITTIDAHTAGEPFRVITSGYVRRTSQIEGTTLVRLLPPRQGRPEIEYFERSETVVLGIGHDTAAKVLDHWLERSEEETLADRSDFVSVMSRCVGSSEGPGAAQAPEAMKYSDRTTNKECFKARQVIPAIQAARKTMVSSQRVKREILSRCPSLFQTSKHDNSSSTTPLCTRL